MHYKIVRRHVQEWYEQPRSGGANRKGRGRMVARWKLVEFRVPVEDT